MPLWQFCLFPQQVPLQQMPEQQLPGEVQAPPAEQLLPQLAGLVQTLPPHWQPHSPPEQMPESQTHPELHATPAPKPRQVPGHVGFVGFEMAQLPAAHWVSSLQQSPAHFSGWQTLPSQYVSAQQLEGNPLQDCPAGMQVQVLLLQ